MILYQCDVCKTQHEKRLPKYAILLHSELLDIESAYQGLAIHVCDMCTYKIVTKLKKIYTDMKEGNL